MQIDKFDQEIYRLAKKHGGGKPRIVSYNKNDLDFANVSRRLGRIRLEMSVNLPFNESDIKLGREIKLTPPIKSKEMDALVGVQHCEQFMLWLSREQADKLAKELHEVLQRRDLG